MITARRCLIRRFQLRQASSSVSVAVGNGDPITLTTGHVARFAAGSVVASQGDNAVLATCVYKRPNGDENPGFLPLTVDYRQSAAAIGKIPTNYLRRELSQSDEDILNSRIIDRSIRPLFPALWKAETQIICKPLSLDEKGDGVILALNAASAALHVSSVPFEGPVAAVRLGYKNGEILVNPSPEERKESSLNMVLAGRSDKKTVMIDMDGKEFSIAEMEAIFDRGLAETDKILQAMDQLRTECGNEKLALTGGDDSKLYSQIFNLAEEKLYYILTDSSHDKISRDEAVKEVGKEVAASLERMEKYVKYAVFQELFSKAMKEMLRKLILENELRCDGRSLKDFRPININVDVYKKLHGSALFQRGQTQVFSTVTFDSPQAAFHPDSISQILGAQRKKMFMLHYEFPGFATNEIATGRASNRREIGHGALAEKALKHVIPQQFPYSIRLASQVLESNGSSSMATVCAGSLAMYDAGVPLDNPVAGVAMGLVTGGDQDNDYKVLTDILGIEDYAGDMDFKMAGSRKGFTAIQLDVKIKGLTRQQLTQSLQQGHDGVNYVLDKMAVMRDRPRAEFKSTVPVIESTNLDLYKRQILFKGGATNAKLIEAETGVKITSEADGSIGLFAPNRERMEEAKRLMAKLMSEADTVQYAFGQYVEVKVVEMQERGIYVQVPGIGLPVFIPNSQLHPQPIKHSSVTGLKIDDKIKVQWLNRDTVTGQIRLSRRVLTGSNQAVKTIRQH